MRLLPNGMVWLISPIAGAGAGEAAAAGLVGTTGLRVWYKRVDGTAGLAKEGWKKFSSLFAGLSTTEATMPFGLVSVCAGGGGGGGGEGE